MVDVVPSLRVVVSPALLCSYPARTAVGGGLDAEPLGGDSVAPVSAMRWARTHARLSLASHTGR